MTILVAKELNTVSEFDSYEKKFTMQVEPSVIMPTANQSVR